MYEARIIETGETVAIKKVLQDRRFKVSFPSSGDRLLALVCLENVLRAGGGAEKPLLRPVFFLFFYGHACVWVVFAVSPMCTAARRIASCKS